MTVAMLTTLLMTSVVSFASLSGQFLWLTDNHVDLWGDVNKAADKRCAWMPIAQWESAVKGMLAADTKPDFIIFSGDFVHFNARNSSDLTQDVILNTITDVTIRMQRSFPNTRLFPCLGNHDYDPSNNWPSDTTQSKWLFKTLVKIWAPWLPAAALATVSETGWYVADIIAGKLRVISLNTNYWAAYNQFTDTSDNDGLAHQQFVWFESELARARKDGVKVYVNGHHPPIGGYVSGNNIDMQDRLWPLYSMRYMLLVQEYISIIEGQFYGHYHVDEVRIQNKCRYSSPDGTTSSIQSCDGDAVGVIYIGPAMTNCNDPSFRVWEYSTASFALTDYRQFHYREEVANNGAVISMAWPLHYRWKDAYGATMQNLNATNWNNEIKRLSSMNASEAEKDAFFARRGYDKYDVHARIFYFCNTIHSDLSAFMRCVFLATKNT